MSITFKKIFNVESVISPIIFQILGDTIVQVRCDKMLSPFVDNVADDEVCQSGPVPQYKYNLAFTG